MPIKTKRANFYDSEEGRFAQKALMRMTESDRFNTQSGYSADSGSYPDNAIPFVDKHMNYLSNNRKVSVEHYISNLRLMTRIK